MGKRGGGRVEQRMGMKGGGTLAVRQEGVQVRFEASRPGDNRGLYKVWLLGEKGGRMLLGTMLPQGNALHLGRTCSIGALERAGCWPLAGAEGVLAFRFGQETGWHGEPHPERYIRDPELRRLKGQVVARQMEEGVELAVPFRTDSPFPMPALFCLARVEGVEGRPHLIWRFDRDGRPELAGKKPGGERQGN